MSAQLDVLLPDCVLPGCRQPVATVGEPCNGCREAFGDQLRQTDGPAMTADEIDARDRTVERVYARREFT